MNINTIQIAESMANDISDLARQVFSDYSLSDSDLHRRMEVQVQQGSESVVIEMLFDNYIEHIEKGRKPLTGRKPPIDALREWALARGIPTDNPTLWAISTAIQRDGYEARPILATIEQRIASYMEDEWADRLLDSLTESLKEYFESK